MLWLAAAFAGGPAASLPPPAVLEAVESTRSAPLDRRIDAISASLLGADYVLDPLGEGAGYDPDPLVRYDVFDCLTYVEEVLALALGTSPTHAAEVRLALRYDGPVAYENRRHFMELQWIPAAIDAGWLVDRTASYGPTRSLRRVVDASTWSAWRSRARFPLRDDQLPVGEMVLDVLSIDDALAAADTLRPGSLLLTVREDRPWSPIWTTHVGIIVHGEEPTVRHATRMGEGLVRDHGLRWYLEHLRTYDKWPVAGVAILEPVEQGPRRSRLDPRAPAPVSAHD